MSAKPDLYTETKITVNAGGQYPLGGLLTLPAEVSAAHKIPAVVLVHGSGSTDQDESVGANKPFADLAHGLAERGTASVRYDKRTLVYGQAVMEELGDNLTVYEETIDDAVSARQVLLASEYIDPQRIYVLGHSLGGMLAPIITERGTFSGAVLLAGTLRSLPEMMDEQYHYLATIPGSGIDQDFAAKAKTEHLNYQALLDGAKSESEIKATKIFGISAYYFKSMDDLNLKEYLLKTDRPFLILQGGSDCQVLPETDFKQYQDLAALNSHLTCKLYPGLTHLFTPTTSPDNGKGTLADYGIPSKVADNVIADIADFIGK
jgi:dienelactone hydrolase